MMHRILILLFACVGPAVPAAWGIHLGDARDKVLAELGEPTTQTIREDAVELLTYPAGEIRLRDGLVCYLHLSDDTITPPPATEREIAIQLRIAELEARLAAAQARLAKAEGATRNASTYPARPAWTTETSITTTYSRAPSSWRQSKPESPPAVYAGSRSGL